MILLAPERAETLRAWFQPEQPGPLVGPHVLNTGNGVCFVDRWPDPQAVLACTASNTTLLGDGRALQPAELHSNVRGFVNASEEMVPLLMAAFPKAKAWERIILERAADLVALRSSDNVIRPLSETDAHHLWRLSPDIAWISVTWSGPAGLAKSGYAWGAFVGGQLASVACTFFLGDSYEEIGVVTEPEMRGAGLGAACVQALCSDIRHRGHVPSWTTSVDNAASLRVAHKLGFVEYGRDTLYAIGVSIPPLQQQEEPD